MHQENSLKLKLILEKKKLNLYNKRIYGIYNKDYELTIFLQ